jgi:hypothetical protein
VTDWNRRELCPDGACIGVIGDDGLCKTCGRAAANWGDERNRGLTPLPPGDDDDEDDDDDDDEGDDLEGDDGGDDGDDGDSDKAPALADDPAADPDWNARKLCTDGACTGVIGADKRCKVCGRSAA